MRAPRAAVLTRARLALCFALLIATPGCGHTHEITAGRWQVAFQSDRNGEWALYALTPGGGQGLRIAGGERPALSRTLEYFRLPPPVPSPDGHRVVIPGRHGLDLLTLATGQLTGLAGGDPSTASWSPDGRWIAFLGLSPGVSVIGADGKRGRRLTFGSGDHDAVWSPDGKQLAFARDRVGTLLVGSDGGHERLLSRREGFYLHWSSDGRRLSFLAGHDGYAVLSTLETVSVAIGRVVRRIPHVTPFAEGEFAWAPDGRRVAWTRTRSSPSGTFEQSQIFVMNADGTERRPVTPTREYAGGPVWSPDGRSILYERNDGLGGSQLWLVRPDGSGRQALTLAYPHGGNAFGAAWIRGPVSAAPAPPSPRLVSRADGALLRNPEPIAQIAAIGSLLVAIPPERVFTAEWGLTPPLVRWDTARGRVDRISLTTCERPVGVAPAAARVAYVCAGGHAEVATGAVRVVAGGARPPVEVFSDWESNGRPRGSLPGRLVGGGRLIVFSEQQFHRDQVVGRRLWRIVGARRVLVKTRLAGEPSAVDGRRIVVERDDGRVQLLSPRGRTLGVVRPRGRVPAHSDYEQPPATVALEGRDLVVLRGGLLQLYDTGSLRPRRRWRVRRGAALAGVARGLVAYAVGDAIHILRLHDGAQAVVRARGVDLAGARLTRAGLFYAVNRKRVSTDYFPIDVANPSRIVFIRRSALVRRLR